MEKMKNLTLKLLAAIAIATVATLPASASDKVAKIGLLAPLSGAAAADGEEMRRGTQLAIDEINAAGGVAGYMLEVAIGDTKDLSPDAVISAFERLKGDKDTNFMMTGYASTSNFEIEYMAEEGMPYFVAGNSAQTKEIIESSPEKFPTIWSFTPSYKLYETGVVPVIEKWGAEGKVTLSNKKIAIISSDNPYSTTIANGIAENAKQLGWEVVTSDLVPFGEVNDWRAFFSKLRDNPPAFIVNTDYVASNAATFISQLLENPTQSLIFIQYAPTIPEFVALTKEKGTGVLSTTMLGLLPSDRTDDIVQKYIAAYGVEPSTYGVALYEMTYMYRDAIEKVGDPTDRAAIAKSLSEVKDHETALGVVNFDPQTHLAKAGDEGMPLHFYQVWEGGRYVVSPQRWANREFQSPPWMEN